MEWLKKLLEAQGLNEAQIKAILEGVTANYTGFVPPHRFEEVNTAKKQLEEDIKERDKQLTELKKNAGDNAALQEQITKLQADNKAATEKYEADMKDLRLSTATFLKT
jgi:DNA-binding transcriptional MerR regulator